VLSNDANASRQAEKLSSIVRERYLWQMQADSYLALYSRLLTSGAL